MGFLTFGGRGISSGTADQHGGAGWVRYSHSHKNARAFNRDVYPASIVFMEFHLALLISIVVLDGYSIHIRIRIRARWYNGDRYPASDCVYGISSRPTGQYGSAG